MFTGIVTARGRVVAAERTGDRLTLSIGSPYPDLTAGESIAVSGACLTVVEVDDGCFTVDVVTTTRGRTRLADLRVGDEVNLERALRVGDRLGGHFVQGHVDGVGTVVVARQSEDALLVDVEVPPELAEVTVLHGSIAVDGVSLTVNAVPAPGRIQVALIPFTLEHTTLGALQAGDRVHLEGDLIGKFVRQLVKR
ncbi:MAG: riboflavin synthase subunit alpha [Gemmatimonadetes bacterium RIFCSPLOWO2_12_FULL_68_9]|nr:MAG: riboflavin synthase subunit alpha [Gemmatimonadetes bacterium RIFCSPLOWO2_12_FULL_68_9]